MTERLKSTLDQWVNLVAISEEGSVQGAAERLNKSHTTLLYSVKKLEDQLGTKLVEVVGNKTRLTANATFLLRKAGTMLEIARQNRVISFPKDTSPISQSQWIIFVIATGFMVP